MTPTLHEIAWHRTFGILIGAIGQPNFWQTVVRRVSDVLQFDNWVALLFLDARPHLLDESPAEDGGPDPLFQDYLRGIYMVDPFYRVNCEQAQSGLFQLRDVAPDCFEQTEYYQRYFRLNVVADEIQFNCRIDDRQLVCLSFGSRTPISNDEIAHLALFQGWMDALIRQHMAHSPPDPQPLRSQSQQGLENLRTVLTPREFDICQLMLSGHSSKRIADLSDISVDTVKTHRRHIYSKLGINTQSELFCFFLSP
jgi:DNA-binding CsgD family transcriptional regulator